VFSNWSNPPAKTWDGQSTDFIMEVVNQSGTIVTARFTIQNSIGGKPSKPPLGWDPRKLDSLYQYDKIYLAWGADFWDLDPIESDVNWSELQRKVGSGAWSTIYSGPNRYWSDSIINYDPNVIDSIYFRARVRDSQNIWSIWSETFDTKMIMSNVSLLENSPNVSPSEFVLSQNYPNPFNPSTKIKYSVPQSSNVVIKVFDILGNEIETLVNEEKQVGTYSVEFNASGLSSGVYFYSLHSGNYIETKKMIFLK
jgi:hypothetical protein